MILNKKLKTKKLKTKFHFKQKHFTIKATHNFQFSIFMIFNKKNKNNKKK